MVENAHVHAGFTWESIRWAFSGAADYWHPLTWLSHMLDWQLYGANPAGHHFTGVLWHAINAVLAFIVMRRLTGSFWASAFGAALFAWHPLRVESVTWITERKDVMSGCFFLLTVWAYTAYAERRERGDSARGRYVLTLVLFAGGLMCKPMLVTLPLLLLALDYWPLRRAGATGWRALLVEKSPFLLLSLAAAVATVWLQEREDAFTLSLPLAARLGNAMVSVVRYLGKFFWPTDLIVCYAHPGYWPLWIVLGAALLVAGIIFIAWRQRQSRPQLLVGWLWFVVMLLPASGLVQVGFQAMADRYTYLPVLGLQLALLASVGESPLGNVGRWLRTTLAALLLAGCACLTWNQQGYWRNSNDLFTHAVAVAPDSDVANGFLCHTLAAEGSDELAMSYGKKALELNARNEMARFAVAKLHARHGEPAEAIANFRQFLEYHPAYAEAEYLLGHLLLQYGDFSEAVGYLRSAAKRQPQYLEANLEIAAAAARAGRTENALNLYHASAELDPSNAAIRIAWAETLARDRQFAAALEQYDRAIQLRPGDAGAHAGRGYMLLFTGHRAEAVAAWTEALRLNPNIPGLRERLEKIRAE